VHFEEPNLESPSKSTISVSPSSSSPSLHWWALLILVWCIGGGYAGAHLKRGWVPHDEGAFAQSADRVLRGELPHRDYTEIYTGGLAYLHAYAFKYLGEDFATPRIVLFVFFLLWIPVFYWIASRMVADWIAGGVTLLAVVWSLPIYPAAVPSWYNLFFATFGVAALFAYLSDHSPKWLFIAGICGGCSFLAKISACYYVAGVLLFLVFSEQCEFLPRTDEARPRSLLYRTFIIVSNLLLLVGLAALVRGNGSVEEFTDFVFPPAILAMLILLREVRVGGGSNRERFLALFRKVLPFLGGLLVPPFALLIPYVRENAIPSFLNGVFLLPLKRISGAFSSPPDLITILPSFFLVGILVLGTRLRGMACRLLIWVTGLVTLYFLISSGYSDADYRVAWHAAYWVMPMLALTGALALWRGMRSDVLLKSAIDQRHLFLLLAVSSFCSLVQYPFSAPVYFCYVAPMAILAAVAVLGEFPSIPKPLLAITFSGFFLFGALRVMPTFIFAMGQAYQPDPETQILHLPKAGNLRVDAESVRIYQQMIPLIQAHAGSGEIYAAPDCPQIYFLAGYRNPTRAIFDFFEEDYDDSERVLKLVDSRPIRVIVLNRLPDFSDRLPEDLHDALVTRFPEGKNLGIFEVRWRK
jgi:hypothetical protein